MIISRSPNEDEVINNVSSIGLCDDLTRVELSELHDHIDVEL